jgi:2-C-methyl-D-erythritol 4-phosphate cytidylyltransferase
MKYWAIIPAAGKGIRMNSALPKQYLQLQNKSVLEHCIDIFYQHSKIQQIVLAVDENDCYWKSLPAIYSQKLLITHGGVTRAHSVYNSLLKLKNTAQPNDWVLVHDAVRPCLQRDDLEKLLNELTDHSVGGLLATPIKDTLKRSVNGSMITTVERNNVWHALTPQMFRFQKILQAIEFVLQKNIVITDDAQALEIMGEHPLLVEGNPYNIKITYPEDLQFAEAILKNMR